MATGLSAAAGVIGLDTAREADASGDRTAERPKVPAGPPQGFAHGMVRANGINMHYVAGGQGDPVVLLHGWPQSWYAWRHVAPLLAASGRTVVMTDMRGYGDSDKPDGRYDTHTLADDVHAVMTGLGYQRYDVVGTDMGVTLAAALALFHRDSVRSVVFSEMVVPGFGTQELAPKLWHWGFLRSGRTAELLIVGREHIFLADHFGPPFLTDPNAIRSADLDEYVRVYSAPGAFVASKRIYQALSVSEQQNIEQVKASGKITVPVLALGAETSLGGTVMQSAALVATNMRGFLLANTGHYVAEEKPNEVASVLNGFLTTRS